jgi:HPt (histidine-containing phosphotransfer) domain-containing protein
MVESIVEVFKEEGLYTLEMIEKGAAGRDAAELKLYCHRMKGTARYLGDDDFVQICLDAELAADEGDVDRAIELSEKIKPVTQKYLEFFERDDWMQILKAKSV